MFRVALGIASVALLIGVDGAAAADSTTSPAAGATVEMMVVRWMPGEKESCGREGGMFFLPNGVVEARIDEMNGTWRYDIQPDGSVKVTDFSVSPIGKQPSPEDLREAQGAIITLRMIDTDTFEGKISGPNIDPANEQGGKLVRCSASTTATSSLAGRWVEKGGDKCAQKVGVFFLENGVLVWEDNNIQGIARYEVQPDQAIIIKDFVASPLGEGPSDKEAVGAVVTLRKKDGDVLKGSAAGPNMAGEAPITLARCPS